MKTVLRILALATLVMGLAALPVFSQTECDPEKKQAEYNTFLQNRPKKNEPKSIEERRVAIEAGKKFLEMCKNSEEPSDKPIITYISDQIPKLERSIVVDLRFKRFDDAAKAKNYAEAFTVAKEILAEEPATSKIALDLKLYLASAALELSYKADGAKFYGEAIKWAKDSIADIEGGKVASSWGLFDLNYKVGADETANKNEALGWMNYTIAEILLLQKQDKDAADFYFKTTQFTSSKQGDARNFNGIGRFYLAEVLKLQEQVKEKFAAQTDADNEEGKKLLAIAKAYAERGVDAFARAQAAYAKANRTEDATKAGDRVNALYTLRFGKSEGKDEYVAGLLKAAMPSPSSEIVPVPEEPEPVATPTATPVPSPTPSM